KPRQSNAPCQRPPSPPGIATRRYLPRFHYELIVCGLRGHVLVGMDAAEVRRVRARRRRPPLVSVPALRLVAPARAAATGPAPVSAARGRDRATAAGEGAARQDRAAGDRRRPCLPLRPPRRARGAALRLRRASERARAAGEPDRRGVLRRADRLASRARAATRPRASADAAGDDATADR